MSVSAALAVAALVAAQPAAPKFELQDGDRIVWLGNTLVEREQRYGHWETALHAAFPDTRFTLRNLGWSGDTVFGDARAGFDTPAKGFERLVGLTLELKPTVIFVCYGTNEAFEGEAGLPEFEEGLEKLLDALKPANARVVLFSPMAFPYDVAAPDARARNKVLVHYAKAIQAIAARRGHTFADLFGGAYVTVAPVSDNGMHLSELGYELTATGFLHSLGAKRASGSRPLDPLRKAIVEKNQLFFYRWRPQNETYLFGFRKHEQGKNAREVAEFDPLVAKAEAEIEKIRKNLLTR